MIIRIYEQQAGQRWVVTLDAWQVGFRRLDEAQAFARTLQGRIDAPHPWPSRRPGALNALAARPSPGPAAP
ncbi:hypothetical protein [Pseudomonas citri]|uniref:hypothetical protein n=1 Tax=Pseudomonas citri TaxID=2978349 RepID=UPI0021B554C9|nr:hypothetical protein [Pseudomonas citri]